MEISKPAKAVLSLRRCSFDVIRNKITFSASSQNDDQNTNTDLNKNNKYSSLLKVGPIPNCIQNLKTVARKPIISSKNVTQHYMGNSLSHMPVYHKVITITICNDVKTEWKNNVLQDIKIILFLLDCFKVLNYFKNVAITDSDGDFTYEDVFRRYVRKYNAFSAEFILKSMISLKHCL